MKKSSLYCLLLISAWAGIGSTAKFISPDGSIPLFFEEKANGENKFQAKQHDVFLVKGVSGLTPIPEKIEEWASEEDFVVFQVIVAPPATGQVIDLGTDEDGNPVSITLNTAAQTNTGAVAIDQRKTRVFKMDIDTRNTTHHKVGAPTRTRARGGSVKLDDAILLPENGRFGYKALKGCELQQKPDIFPESRLIVLGEKCKKVVIGVNNKTYKFINIR